MAQIDEIVGKKNIEEIMRLDAEIIKLHEDYKKLIATIQEGTSANIKSFTELKNAQKKTTDQARKLTTAEKEQQKIRQQTERITVQLLEVSKRSRVEQEKWKRELQQSNRTTKLQVAANQALKGSYEQISASMRLNIQRYQQMSAAERDNTRTGKQLQKTIRAQNNELKKLDAQMGVHNRNVGNYLGSMKRMSASLLGAFGVVGGVMMFARVLRDAANVVKEFDKSQTNLAAILGKTRAQTEALTRSAQQLGASTVFTASQVTSLQIELGKLGFTEDQILATSRAVLDLAAATGADLGEAAKVTGVALRAFGLEMEQADDVAATLAISTTKSALAFADFETMLSTAGPVANAFGFSLEDMVALMGQLKNAGFDASTASTALRNILLNLADSSGALAQELGGAVNTLPDLTAGLKTLDERGIDLATTLELTDKRSVAAFNTFLSGADAVNELREGITGVTGELKEMVATQLDSVAGDVTLLTSAWQGFILSVDEGDGVISKFIRGTFRGLTNMFQTWAGVTSEQEKATEQLMKYTQFMDLMNTKYQHLATSEENMIELVQQLRGELNLSTDDMTFLTTEIQKHWEEVRKAINKVDEPIEQTTKKIEKQTEAIKRQAAIDVQGAIEAYYKRQQELIDRVRWGYIGAEQAKVEATEDSLQLRTEAIDAFYAYMADRQEETIEQEGLTWQQRQELAITALNTIGEIGSAIYQQRLNNIDSELDAVRNARESELALYSDNKEMQAKINAKYAKKESQLRKEQAEQQKKQALFSAIINTAAAIVSAATTQPFIPLGVIAMALAGALGAVQIAAIASQPIPAFAKGTESAPDGLISVGEKGRELIQTKSGKLLMANEPTVTTGLKGARIYSNPETEAMLAAARPGYDSTELRNTLERNNEKLIRTIKNKREIHISASRREIREREGGNWTTYKNRYFR